MRLTKKQRAVLERMGSGCSLWSNGPYIILQDEKMGCGGDVEIMTRQTFNSLKTQRMIEVRSGIYSLTDKGRAALKGKP